MEKIENFEGEMWFALTPLKDDRFLDPSPSPSKNNYRYTIPSGGDI